MSSSTGRAPGEVAGAPGGDPAPAGERPGSVRDGPAERAARAADRNRLATISLAAGIAGLTLVTIIPAIVCGVVALRRAGRRSRRQRGSGRARALAGIAFSLAWAVAGVILIPHLARASDPGCTAYKGRALTAYRRVIADFNGGNGRAAVTRDLSAAAGLLSAAARRSGNAGTSRALSRFAGQLRRVLADIGAGRAVPDAALRALNRDAARTDRACGTLRV